MTTPDGQARLDQLAHEAATAAEIHGPESPEHDRAMGAYAEAEEEAQAG
jgi:hypothetical protein